MPAPIRTTVYLNAPCERVYDAFATSAGVESWFARGFSVSDDGAWSMDFGGGVGAAGRVLEAARPDRYVWTWEVSRGVDEQGQPWEVASMVTITYTYTAEDGGTRFEIEEAGHATEEVRAMNESGIEGMIPLLRAWVEDGRAVDWDAVAKARQDGE